MTLTAAALLPVMVLLAPRAQAAPHLQRLEASHPAALVALQPADPGSLLLRSFQLGPYDGDPGQAALAFLGEHGGELGLASMDLQPLRSSAWRDRQRAHLGQLHRGVPVLGAGAVVGFDGQGYAVTLTADLDSDLWVDVQPGLSRDRALALALAAVDGPLRASPELTLAVLPDARGGRLVYRARLFTAGPFGHWLVRLDAHSGEILRVADQRRTAWAEVYEHNPVNSELVEVELPGLEAGDTVLDSDIAVVSTVVFDGSSSNSATASRNARYWR